jgi:hypothetical protein
MKFFSISDSTISMHNKEEKGNSTFSEKGIFILASAEVMHLINHLLLQV